VKARQPVATDRKVSTELEKLGKLVSTLAEGMTQLQLDVAKMSARIAAIDDQVGSIGRRLDRDGSPQEDQASERDLALEQEVFKKFGSRPVAVTVESRRQKKPEPRTKPTAKLSKAKRVQKQKR
jgi:hypothetical protein